MAGLGACRVYLILIATDNIRSFEYSSTSINLSNSYDAMKLSEVELLSIEQS
jgi:hypothetical protein